MPKDLHATLIAAYRTLARLELAAFASANHSLARAAGKARKALWQHAQDLGGKAAYDLLTRFNELSESERDALLRNGPQSGPEEEPNAENEG